MRTNPLRESLRNGTPTLGTRVMSSWPTVIEMVGRSGQFDYVEFVAEYAPYDLTTLEHLGRTIELFDHMSGMIKIQQESRLHLCVRAIGAGIQNVLFADVRPDRPESAGHQGVAMHRSCILDAGTPEWATALDETVVAIMIEKRSAIDELEAILAVPGIDMVQFGPADYSMSIGRTGERRHPEVLEAERHTLETALRMGVAPRVELAQAAGFDPYLEMGVRHFNIGVDVQLLSSWYQESGAVLRKELGAEQLNPRHNNKPGYGQ
jgi:4-hydroxy-2-oxoheptanedioate aldolase